MAHECKGRLAEFLDIIPLPQPCSPQPRAHWQPPQADVVKINFDGAKFSVMNKVGIGVVACDNVDLVLASLSQQIPQAYLAKEIKTLAACKAHQFAFDIGITNVVLKGHSQILMTRLIDDIEVLSYSGVLLDDVHQCSHFF